MRLTLFAMTFFYAFLGALQADEVDEFLGAAPQKIDYHNGDWSIEPEKMDKDKISYKEQNSSLIEWDKIDPVEWLDVTNWMASRKIRDEHPEWKIKYRDFLNKELVAKVIACSGECRLYRGIKSAKAQFLSEIREGDEIVTAKDSTLWIMLINGTIMRFSSESSMSFNEFNISENEYFYYLRLNYGHVHSEYRYIGNFNFEDKAETDPSVLPIAFKEANRENFARKAFQSRADKDFEFVVTDYPGAILQKEELNQLIKKNSKHYLKRNQKIFLVSPNSSLLIENSHFDFYYELHGKSFFRLTDQRVEFEKTDDKKGSATVFFRGYSNTNSKLVDFDTWYEVNQNGREINQNDELASQFKPIEFIVSRVPTILMARELLLRKFSTFVFKKLPDEESFALNFGYKIWNKEDEYKNRLSWLQEYTRRVETTQLGSMEKIKKEEPLLSFPSSYYLSSFHAYLKEIKHNNQKAKRQIAEMNDIEYYVHILKKNK